MTHSEVMAQLAPQERSRMSCLLARMSWLCRQEAKTAMKIAALHRLAQRRAERQEEASDE
jgi:hypothetical protein